MYRIPAPKVKKQTLEDTILTELSRELRKEIDAEILKKLKGLADETGL